MADESNEHRSLERAFAENLRLATSLRRIKTVVFSVKLTPEQKLNLLRTYLVNN